MNLIIHRGTHEIGGNCVELESNGFRIIFDLGMPLVEPRDKKKKFDSFSIGGKSASALISSGVLPLVKGLYRGVDSEKPVDALLISHAHQDHYGLTGFLRQDIPVYLGEETSKLIEISDLFLHIKAKIDRPNLFKQKPFKIGPFRITPYLMDHSAFGANAFLIEANGKSAFYSGDFRGHGRKAKLFSKFIRTAPSPVDCLIMEGTTLGRPDKEPQTEEELEVKIIEVAKKYSGIKLLYASGQNIDRMVTFYRAALQTKALFVTDLYVAYLLDELHRFGRIPYPSKAFKNLKVFFSKRMMRHLYRQGRKHMVAKYRPFEITAKEMRDRKGDVFLICRGSLLDDIRQVGRFEHAVFIYSMYTGYMKEPSFSAINEFLKAENISMEVLHTSGHASFQDLKRLVKAVHPNILVPIHTFEPRMFKELHRNTRILADGEALTID